MKLLSKTLLIIMSVLLVSACSFKGPNDLKLGKYVMEDTETEDFAWVLLEENNQFQFNRNIATSYLPMGSYSVEEDELILQSGLDEIYRFKISGNSLIFESGKAAESLVEKGTVFVLTKNK